MLKLLISCATLLLVSNANANFKNDLSGLDGNWTGVSCDAGGNPGPMSINVVPQENHLWIQMGERREGYDKVDQGSSSDEGGDCHWGICGTKWKTKYKAKTIAANKVLIKGSEYSKGMLDIFWHNDSNFQIIYELIDTKTLRRSEIDPNADNATWKSCFFQRK